MNKKIFYELKVSFSKKRLNKNVNKKFIFSSSFVVAFLILSSMSYSYYDPINLNNAWKQFPLRNQWQKDNDLAGGEGMAMIYDFDWNRKDTNIIYFVVDTNRVWKSVNRGSNWFPIAQGLKVIGGVSIASDPNNPNVVFFAGSEHHDEAYDVEGVYRSLDGGNNWEKVSGLINFKRRHAGKLFLIDPDSFNGVQSQTIYAGTPEGILKSDNGGSAWQSFALTGHDIYDLEWSDTDRSVMYVSTEQGFYKVFPKDLTVLKIGSGLPSHPWDAAVSSQNADIVFVVAGNSVYKSMDGGVNFSIRSNGIRSDINYQRIAMSRLNHDKLILVPHLAAGNVPYWTSDGGQSWHEIENTHKEEMLTGWEHWSARPVIFDPENEDIAIRYSTGPILKTFDGGNSWHYSGNGYTGLRIHDISFVSENTMLFCGGDYGLFLAEDGGESFKDLNLPRNYGHKSCLAADMVGDTIIASSGTYYLQDLMLSRDRGETWEKAGNVSGLFNFIEFSKENNNIVYSDDYVSFDEGATWSVINDNYKIVAVDPKNSSVIYGISNISYYRWQLAVSHDFGQTWSNIGSSIIAAEIGDVVINPHSENLHILVAAKGFGVYEFKNSSWNNLLDTSIGLGFKFNKEQFNYIRFDPNNHGIIGIAKRGLEGEHSGSVFLSTDNGKTWTNVINNLGPYNDFWNIEISPYDRKVYLTGPGVWTFSYDAILEVDIDIRIGSNSNIINLTKGNKLIPVFILTTDEFDATSVDHLSVQFGPDKAEEIHGKGHIKDVDDDGDHDLVLHFRTQETGISCGDTEAGLTGETFDGQAIEGFDSIKTVRCN